MAVFADVLIPWLKSSSSTSATVTPVELSGNGP